MPISEFLQGVRDRVMVADDEKLPPEELEKLEASAKAEIDAADAALDADPTYIEPDPAPARKARTRTTRAAPPRPAKVTVATKKSVADALTMMIQMPAAMLMFKDPVCAGAVLAQSDEVVDKLVPIVCRNPRLLEWFTTGAGYMDWFALATAVFPIAKTVWMHHVTRPHDMEDPYGGNPPDFSQYTAPDLAD